MDGIKMLTLGSPGAATLQDLNAYLRTFIKKPETLNDLLQLSGKDLYMQGKLEKLKELSPEHYKLKYAEFFGYNPDGSPLPNATTNEQAEHLNELLKLSAEELYMNDKLEDLKELSLSHFKLKFTELFGIEYKA